MFLLMCMYMRNLYVYEMGLGWVLASNAWEREMKEEGECFREKNERGVGREKISWVVVTEVLLLI